MATHRDDEYSYAGRALPTPTDTPYRTPSRSLSRHSQRSQSQRRGSTSPPISSSPPPLPPNGDAFGHSRQQEVDVANDESISPLDPRRFTPTLHASLVSEILSLRRDLEGKSKAIDSLEASLDSSRSENETISKTLAGVSKESRSLKRQMQLLEGGTLSALSELAKERDEALDGLTESKKRLDQSQKKSRSQEEDHEMTMMLWDRDKQTWEGEKRNLERKVHVVEGRLKTVLHEVAASQANNHHDDNEQDVDEIHGVGRGSDTTSHRSSSAFGKRRTSTNSIGTQDGDPHAHRFSVLGLPNGHAAKDGQSLAEELAFDEEEEDQMYEQEHDGAPESPNALPEERPMSVQSRPIDLKARKVLGLAIDSDRSGTPDFYESTKMVERMPEFDESEEFGDAQELQYVDTGVQYSPPPSPNLPATPESLTKSKVEEPLALSNDHGANQGRKRVSANQGSMSSHSTATRTPTPPPMISTSSQTIGDLPSPPWTPKVPLIVEPPFPIEEAPKFEMTSVSTQTEAPEPPRPDTANTADENRPMLVPTIAIHPPASGPSSPRDSVVLPPRTKNASCQVQFSSPVQMCDTSMQTEEIRVDRRPVRLPPNLLPSAISTAPELQSRAVQPTVEPKLPSYKVPPPRLPRRKMRSPPPLEGPPQKSRPFRSDRKEFYPGNNDDGPLADDSKPDIRRPARSSSLFAGFEQPSDDEADKADEAEFSEEDFFNRPMVSYTLKSGRMVSKPSSPVLESDALPNIDEPEGFAGADKESFGETPRSSTQSPPPSSSARGSNKYGKMKQSGPPHSRASSSSKQPNIRRAAMISSGTAAHQSARPRSPSEPSIKSNGSGVQPPFPVPTRLSSRKIPISSSEGARSPTPYSNDNFPERRQDRGIAIPRKNSLRKVRSAAAIPRQYSRHERPRSRSPPLSASSAALESPLLPPMPMDQITAPPNRKPGKLVKQRPAPFTHTSSHDSRPGSGNGAVQQTSVVDAIAQTMVGEWMWKYVRRRKSFGVSDSTPAGWEIGKTTEEVNASITGGGVRHKRWVWLAPYERAVMWSSKQPTSGSALLGKSGRKLTIQSVLDVKDDNALPKGATPTPGFNRSILILTPQRALKFTAMTQERHYVWLTALSFLSHSSLGVSELAAFPPVPQQEYEPPPRSLTASLRRNPIRDSITVAKGKEHQVLGGKRSFTTPVVPTIPQYPIKEVDLHYAPNEPISDAADPPTVPRFSAHSRKRSNTAPRPPPSSFRTYSHTAVPSTYSATTAASSDIYTPSTFGGHGFNSGQSSFSGRRTSEASGPSGIIVNNFFDAVGTVRMDAFVNQNERPRGSYRTRQGRKKDMAYWGGGPEGGDVPRPENSEDGFFQARSEDPFRGF